MLCHMDVENFFCYILFHFYIILFDMIYLVLFNLILFLILYHLVECESVFINEGYSLVFYLAKLN